MLSGANSYTGATQLMAGTTKAGGTAVFNQTLVTLAGGATLDLNGNSNTVGALNNDNSGTGGTVTNSGVAATLTTGGNNSSGSFAGVLQDGAGVLSLTKIGTGVQILTGVSTYTGTTTITAGTLQLGSGAVNGTIGAGPVNITGGVLQVGNGGTGGTLGAGPVTIASGAQLTFSRSDTVTLSNALNGAGTLYKSGGNTLVYTGSSTLRERCKLAVAHSPCRLTRA